MAPDIQSKEVIDKISQDLKIQPAMQVPRGLMDKIQLVYNVNPVGKNRILKTDADRTTTSVGASLFTASPTKKTFLTGLTLSSSSTAAADNTVISVNINTEGVNARVLHFTKPTLTADKSQGSVNFNPPIELTKGTSVTLENAFTVGASTTTTTIIGFETDPQ